jgi:hypothetical protein
MAQVKMGRYEVEKRELPGVCARCGQPTRYYKTKNFSWYPPWIGITILIALPVFLILALVMTKRMTVGVPLCDKHKYHWGVRLAIILLGLLAVILIGVGALVLGGMISDSDKDTGATIMGLGMAGAGVLFLVWLITVVVVQSTAIRPTEITDTSITLTGLSDAFVEAVESEAGREDDYDRPRPRPRSRPAPRDEDEGYRPPQPRRRPPPESYRADE